MKNLLKILIPIVGLNIGNQVLSQNPKKIEKDKLYSNLTLISDSIKIYQKRTLQEGNVELIPKIIELYDKAIKEIENLRLFYEEEEIIKEYLGIKNVLNKYNENFEVYKELLEENTKDLENK